MAKYAEGTTVSAINSRMEIEKLILKYAGPNAEFAYMQQGGLANVMFAAHGRKVRFALPLPSMDEAKVEAKRKNSWGPPGQDRQLRWVEDETRRRWRCLVLAIKAKLEVVESGIATFEEEFLAHIVSPQGVTVYEMIKSATDGIRMLPPLEKGNVIELVPVQAEGKRP